MAQHSSLATSEHRRHPPPLPRQDWVPHRIDASVEAVQTTCLKANIDRLRAEPDPQQLRAGHHAVLPRRKGGDLDIQPLSLLFTVHNTVKCRLSEVRPLGGGLGARGAFAGGLGGGRLGLAGGGAFEGV